MHFALLNGEVNAGPRFIPVVGEFRSGLQPFIDSKVHFSLLEDAYRRTPAYIKPVHRNMSLLYTCAQRQTPLEEAIFIDFHERFRESEPEPALFFDICHPLPEGNRRIAEAYADALWTRYGETWIQQNLRRIYDD